MDQQVAIRWRANENFMMRTIADESVLIPIGEVPDPRFENCMINMNETSAFLWNLFAEAPTTEEEAVAAAEAEFSAPPGVIAQHIHIFVTTYDKLGLLLKEEE